MQIFSFLFFLCFLYLLQTVTNAAAAAMFNGNNETKVGFSQMLEIRLYDSYERPIEVKNLRTPIEILIPKDPILSFNPKFVEFIFVNATNQFLTARNQFLPGFFILNNKNGSIHIQLQPLNASVGYFITIKFGRTPIFNRTHRDFDWWRVYCPQGWYIHFEFVFIIYRKKRIFLYFFF
jgi:hypothetical protein